MSESMPTWPRSQRLRSSVLKLKRTSELWSNALSTSWAHRIAFWRSRNRRKRRWKSRREKSRWASSSVRNRSSATSVTCRRRTRGAKKSKTCTRLTKRITCRGSRRSKRWAWRIACRWSLRKPPVCKSQLSESSHPAQLDLSSFV